MVVIYIFIIEIIQIRLRLLVLVRSRSRETGKEVWTGSISDGMKIIWDWSLNEFEIVLDGTLRKFQGSWNVEIKKKFLNFHNTNTFLSESLKKEKKTENFWPFSGKNPQINYSIHTFGGKISWLVFHCASVHYVCIIVFFLLLLGIRKACVFFYI